MNTPSIEEVTEEREEEVGDEYEIRGKFIKGIGVRLEQHATELARMFAKIHCPVEDQECDLEASIEPVTISYFDALLNSLEFAEQQEAERQQAEFLTALEELFPNMYSFIQPTKPTWLPNEALLPNVKYL